MRVRGYCKNHDGGDWVNADTGKPPSRWVRRKIDRGYLEVAASLRAQAATHPEIAEAVAVMEANGLKLPGDGPESDRPE